MSTRNLIGSGPNSTHPLLGKRWIALSVFAYLVQVKTAYRVTRLYANEIYACEESHAMILISWIETFVFVRDVIIQMMPKKWIFLINKSHK